MATVSGTVSEATGGKFANGAMTGAFVHMFNAEAHAFTNRSYNKNDFIKANVQLNQNKVDSFFGKALLFFAGGGAAGSAAKFGYGYVVRNPESIYWAEVINDIFNESMPPITPHGIGANVLIKGLE